MSVHKPIIARKSKSGRVSAAAERTTLSCNPAKARSLPKRRFICRSGKVHFLACIRVKQLRCPRLGHPLRNLTHSRRIPPPLTVAGQALCLVNNCPTHGTLSLKGAHWLISLRPCAAIARRLGLHGAGVEDAAQSALTFALCSWGSFHTTPEAPEHEQRRQWLARLVWRVASKAHAERNRERSVKSFESDGQLTSCTTPPREPQLAARRVLRSPPGEPPRPSGSGSERRAKSTGCPAPRSPGERAVRPDDLQSAAARSKGLRLRHLGEEAAARAEPLHFPAPRKVR